MCFNTAGQQGEICISIGALNTECRSIRDRIFFDFLVLFIILYRTIYDSVKLEFQRVEDVFRYGNKSFLCVITLLVYCTRCDGVKDEFQVEEWCLSIKRPNGEWVYVTCGAK